MDCNDFLALLTLGAVAPYLAEATWRWITDSARCALPPNARQRCASQQRCDCN